jgi:hypothetical protein
LFTYVGIIRLTGRAIYDIHVDSLGPICIVKVAKVVVCGSGGQIFERTNHMPRIW